jgi:hypothetical protein
MAIARGAAKAKRLTASKRKYLGAVYFGQFMVYSSPEKETKSKRELRQDGNHLFHGLI